jgi:tetratricopeptide (TPR) repeat protein
MKRLATVIIILILHIGLAQGQASLHTAGKQSPIIKGAHNKINYLTQEKSKLSIPDELIPYLSGLLMMNKIDANSRINEAVNLWMSKYSELKAAVNAMHPGEGKAQAIAKLQKGDFPAVEQLLNIHTNYKAITQIFSNSYLTSGDFSPILVGDYNNVTYTVSKIIEYDLPEGITVNLLTELKSKDIQIKTKNNSLQLLQGSLSEKETTIKSWIKRYRDIEQQLKNSPDAISQKAYALFQNGDLNGALLELDKGLGGDVVMAKNRILKAKILMLKLDYKTYDDQLNKIKVYYETSVPFIPSYNNYLEYAKFLVDYKRDFAAAAPVLQSAMAKATDYTQLVEIDNYLALAFGNDRLKSVSYLEQALNMLNAHEPLQDAKLIDQKTLIQYNIGVTCTTGGYIRSEYGKAIQYTLDAIKTNERLPLTNTKRAEVEGRLFQTLGRLRYQQGEITGGLEGYRTAKTIFEKLLPKNPQIFSPLAALYSEIADANLTIGRSDTCIYYLINAKNLVEPNINLNNKSTYVQLSGIYSSIGNYYSSKMLDSSRIYLVKLDSILEPFFKNDPAFFLNFKATLYTDLGTVFMYKQDVSNALRYLEGAFQCYISDLGNMQYNIPKFLTCTQALTSAYIAIQNPGKAVDFNLRLMADVDKASRFNPIPFQVVMPQVYSQLSGAYLGESRIDSAIIYCQMARKLIEDLTKKYAESYVVQYGQYTNQLVNLLLIKKDLPRVDSLLNSFDAVWENVYSINDYANTGLRCTVGEQIANIAFNFYQYELSQAINKEITIRYTNKFLDLAQKHFQNWHISNESLKDIGSLATFYYRRAYLENDLTAQTVTDTRVSNTHAGLKCEYLTKAKQLFPLMPDNRQLNVVLKNQIMLIPAGNCQ